VPLLKEFAREVDVMRELSKHSHIAHIVGLSVMPPNIAVVFRLYKGGSLQSFLNTQCGLTRMEKVLIDKEEKEEETQKNSTHFSSIESLSRSASETKTFQKKKSNLVKKLEARQFELKSSISKSDTNLLQSCASRNHSSSTGSIDPLPTIIESSEVTIEMMPTNSDDIAVKLEGNDNTTKTLSSRTLSSRSSSTLTARTDHVEFNALCLLSWAERSKMAIDLCDAVMYLHSLNPPILHRDIKPGNVLLDSKGRMYKLDVEALPLYVIIHTHTHTHTKTRCLSV